jgi:hypothetical protein
MRSEERKMSQLLEVLLNIVLELLPAIGEVLLDNPVKSAAPTQKTFKTNTSRKHVRGQDRSPGSR